MRIAKTYRWIIVWAAVSIAGIVATSLGEAQEVARFPIVDAPARTPGLGAGFRSARDIYIGEDERTDLIPLYLFEGKYLFAHGTSVGVHLFRNDNFSLDVLSRYRFNRLDPDGNELLQGLTPRHQSVDAGFAAGLRGRYGDLQLTWVADVLDQSNGSETDLTYRFPVDYRNWGFSPYVSAIWQEDNLTRYYYGVSPDEAAPGRPAYQPGDAFNFVYGLNTSYQFTNRMFAFANIAFTAIDNTIANSPIVRSSNNASAFVGAAYLFGDHELDTSDRSSDSFTKDRPRWGYRLHYGRQAKQNIFPLLMAGWWEKTYQVPDTQPKQMGLTISRVVQTGKRVDFYARFGLFRHFEQPFQEEFWSYNVFITAMFKAYFPWSEKVALRYGVSFGVSYADEIPALEVFRFEERGFNSSHLLNYLEWQVDLSLDSIFKSEITRDCFIGVTAPHRSGIFGTSDLLGNVSGGADWITLHVECLR
jgi:outer membrane protein